MDRDHFPYPVAPPGQQTDRRAEPAQDAQLIYLRQHGKYLTPGRGVDLVSGIAVVLRGFLLNLLVWLPIAALLLLVLLVVPPLDTFFPPLTFDDASYQNGYGWMAAALASVTSASVVSHANIYNWSRGANGGIFRAALPRLTLRMMSFADFVQTKGFGSALLCSM